MNGYVRRRDHDHRQAAWLAVHVGILSQVAIEHIPSPAELVGGPAAEPLLLSEDQMLARLQAMSCVTVLRID